jgi:hypothetical protein
MSNQFDITTETKGLKLRASFSIDELFDSMSGEQKLLMAELLSCDDTIIEYVTEQLCAGFIDPRADGSWSVNYQAIEKAREQIVDRMGEFIVCRDRTIASTAKRERHSGMLDGITVAFERLYGERNNWGDSTEERYIDVLRSIRDK